MTNFSDKPRDPKRIKALAEAIEKVDKERRYFALKFYEPYPKQQMFHDLGATHKERMFRAGNRVGKTYCGGAEMSIHLTGRYPDGWLGRTFERPIEAWVAGDTGLTTRDILQEKLCGKPGVVADQGTGLIPRDDVDWVKGISLARGVADLYDTVQVSHHGRVIDIGAGRSSVYGKVDGTSTLTFKSYEQGRKKWQGTAKDVIWYDEEPDMEIYSEGTTRLAPTEKGAKAGIEYLTATPLLGKTPLILRFEDKKLVDCVIVQMSIHEAEHIDPDEKARTIAGYLQHEREARTFGVPLLGSGKIFLTPEDKISVAPFPIPTHWALIWGTDFGVDHPFAAVLLLWDRDNDVVYVAKTIRMSDSLTIAHAAAMKPCAGGMGWKVPCAWPQDGWTRKEFDGTLEPLAEIYRKHGVKMLGDHSKFEDGSNSTELGIIKLDERMKTNKFKVFNTETNFFEEYRDYHRKDGKIVKVNDDILSAVRVGVMSLRDARPVLWRRDPNQGPLMAKGIDDDPWAV